MVKGSRVIGYIRVSTSEQADSRAGLDAQRSAIAAECERRGFELVEVIEDAAQSGKTTARPGLRRALAMLNSRQVDGVVVAKLDRLSRSVVDLGKLLEQSKRRGWSLTALDLGVDTTTAAGELVANVMASVAQWERRAIGERTKAALAAKRAQGVRLGRPRSLPQPVVERIVSARAGGMSFRKIAEQLNADRVPTAHGGQRWHLSTVQAVLASRS